MDVTSGLQMDVMAGPQMNVTSGIDDYGDKITTVKLPGSVSFFNTNTNTDLRSDYLILKPLDFQQFRSEEFDVDFEPKTSVDIISDKSFLVFAGEMTEGGVTNIIHFKSLTLHGTSSEAATYYAAVEAAAAEATAEAATEATVGVTSGDNIQYTKDSLYEWFKEL